MIKSIQKVLFFTFIIIIFSCIFVYGETNTLVKTAPMEVETIKLSFPEIVDIVEQEVDGVKKQKIVNATGSFTLELDSPEYKFWIEEVRKSIKNDAKKGLDLLAVSDVTLDHIKLEVWGEFLNKYNDKTITNFPIGDIKIKFGSYNFVFKSNELTKTFIKDTFIPILIDEIESMSKNYPVKRYVLEVPSAMLLNKYEFNVNNVKEVETIYPLSNLDSYIISNVGSYYGFSLSREYVEVLRGYIEGDLSGYDKPVKGSYPGCVNVLAYITLLKNVNDGTLSDKTISDFMIYKNLAIRLDTKELIDTSDMTTNNKILNFSDFKINPDILLLTPINNDIVVIQPTYLECFYYNGVNKNFGRFVDFTEFVINGTQECFIYNGENKIGIPILYFADSSARLDTQLGNSPFLIYYSSHVPYDLLINWAYNQSGSFFSDTKVRNKFIDQIKEDLQKENRNADFKLYMKEAGQASTFKIIFIIVVLLIVSIVVFLIFKKKKKFNSLENTPISDSELLFNSYEDNEESDDDGDFELK